MKLGYLVIVAAAAFMANACDSERVSGETVTQEQHTLREAAKVSTWPKNDQLDRDSQVAELKPSECDSLGGDVEYHEWCGTYRLKCVIGDRAICIDELDDPDPGPDPE